MTISKWVRVVALAAIACSFPMISAAGSLEDAEAAFDRQDASLALRLYSPLAESGNAQAQYRLGIMYQNGLGVTHDNVEALRWFRKSAEQGNADAQHNVGFHLSYGYGVPRDQTEAVKWTRMAAEQGHASAMFSMGVAYEHGEGVSKDFTKALKWYRMAEDGGRSAKDRIDHILKEQKEDAEQGPVLGRFEDAAKMKLGPARRLYRRLAAEGDVRAQLRLGAMYANGWSLVREGVSQDYAEAARWFKMAAAKGDPKAQYFLGCIRSEGRGGPRDPVEAVKWYAAAAENGHALAQYELGLVLGEGRGVPANELDAMKWFRLAAEQGHGGAEFELGSRLLEGSPLRAEPSEAMTWLRRSAERGDESSMFALGNAHAAGRGVKLDTAEALQWYRKAGLAGEANFERRLKSRGEDDSADLCVNRTPESETRRKALMVAAESLRRLAEKGEAVAQTQLGFMYSHGWGVAIDHKAAAGWTRKAAEQGDLLAQRKLAQPSRFGTAVEKDERRKWLFHAANGGDGEAQYSYGLNLYYGGYGEENHAEAAKWYLKAANQGHAGAMFNLGVMHGVGKGVQRDFTESVRWYRAAAAKGNPDAIKILGMYNRDEVRGLRSGNGTGHDDWLVAAMLLESAKDSFVKGDYATAIASYLELGEKGVIAAQSKLGYVYGNGEGVPPDAVKSAAWFEKAAKQGDSDSQAKMGYLLRAGKGVERDFVTSASWYRKAAEQGNAEGQDGLARMYRMGSGVQADVREAALWYRKAADQGYAPAQYDLAWFYKDGTAVPRSVEKAISWFRKAAEQDYAEAEFMLGVIYLKGDGVRPDKAQGKKWLSKAAGHGLEKASAFLAQNDAAVARREIEKPIPSETRAMPHTIVRRDEPPRLNVADIPSTTERTVDLSGRVVSGGRITSLTIDGTEVPVGRDGRFADKRGIPLGLSTFRLVATDEWGQSSELKVSVVRSAAAMETSLPQLDPGRARGKPRPDALALIIGVERYKSAPPAEFAENDARSFYDYAVNALGVPASRVKLLTGTEAQRIDVEAAILTWLKPQIVKGRTEIFVFFAGHGLASDDGKEIFLLPQDANRALLDRSAIKRGDLIDAVIDAGATSAVFFIDACYSGGTRGGETLVTSGRPLSISARERSIPLNVTVITAAGNDQLSSSLPSLGHGLFSYFLMKGLEGEAAGPNRTITTEGLMAYLVSRVPAEAARLGRSQTPQLSGDGKKVMSSW
jgi:TPR repeat protein